MKKEFKIKKIANYIDSNYITNIDDIMTEIKDITIESKILDIKKLEFDKEIMVFLLLKDSLNSLYLEYFDISSLLVGNRDGDFKKLLADLNINHNYLFKGDTLILREPDTDLIFIKDKIKDFVKVGDLFFLIKSLQKID